jgi:hypothetical protein
MLDIKTWSCEYPYEYDVWANTSWYCNLDYQSSGDQENGYFIGNNNEQARYLGQNNEWVDRSSDTNRDYGENSLIINSPGWENWIQDQLDRAVTSGVGYIEWDNADNTLDRSPVALLQVYQKTIGLGLRPLLKNPTIDQVHDFAALRNEKEELAVAGAIFEYGTITPAEFGMARQEINPTLEGTWVRHSGNINEQDIPTLCKQVRTVQGTSVQWGPREYHGMRVLVCNPFKK